MSRLLLVAIAVTVAAPVLLGVLQQPSTAEVPSMGLTSVVLPAESCGLSGCLLGSDQAALLARRTRGTLGGERAARRRARTNFSSRL